MPGHPLQCVLDHIRRLARTPAADALSDGQLLQRFAQTRDEAAFQTLLDRHGPMVMRVCRCVLADPHDADDAFQATFLVLIRKAKALTLWGSLASWLYGVAYRTALKARSEVARRRRYERQAAVDPQTDAAESESPAPELRQVLDQELSRLPEKYRAPLVLCYLEGKTNEEAARLLGWPLGSMSRRLEKGRELLRVRLVRRGMGLSGSAIAAAMAESAASSAVPVALARTTLQVAGLVVAGQAATASKPALVLMEGVLRQMAYSKVKVGAVLLLMLSFLGAGAAVVMLPFAPTLPHETDPVPVADPFAEPLPPGTVARLGTSRWWQPEQITTLLFSPDGRWLVTNRDRGLPFYIREVSTGKPPLQFSATDRTGFDENMGYNNFQSPKFLFSPDGKTLAVRAHEYDLRKHDDSSWWFGIALWDTTNGRQLLSFAEWEKRFEGRVWGRCFAFSPDSKVLAVQHCALDSHHISLLEVATGKEILRVKSDLDWANLEWADCLAFSPNGKILAARSQSTGIVLLLDAYTGQKLRNLAEPMPSPLSFSPDGKTLIGGPSNRWILNPVVECDVATGVVIRRTRSEMPKSLSPDGKTEMVFDEPKWQGIAPDFLSLRETATGREIRRLRVNGEPERQLFPQFTFSPDSKALVEVHDGDGIQLWDVKTGELLPQNRGVFDEFTTAAFSPDGRPLVVGRVGEVTSLWDVNAAKAIYRFDNSIINACPPSLFSPDGSLLSVDSGILSLKESKPAYLRRNKQAEFGSPLATIAADNEQARSGRDLAISADNKLLISGKVEGNFPPGKAKGVIEISEVSTGKKLRQFVWTDTIDQPVLLDQGGIWAAALSPDGGILAVLDPNSDVTLWTMATGKMLHRIKDGHAYSQFAFSPDGKTLALIGDEPSVLGLCDVVTGKTVFHTLLNRAGDPLWDRGFDGLLQHLVVWSPDGRLLATADNGGTIYLLDASTGKERGQLHGHRGPIRALAFSADGKRLLSASQDQTALVWDVRQGLRTKR